MKSLYYTNNAKELKMLNTSTITIRGYNMPSNCGYKQVAAPQFKNWYRDETMQASLQPLKDIV